ncbi:MAG: hypothetical protein PHY80_04445 [Rickettsiales bacterium]|nr:hypothetical protein [Rickettsiales bacterium]
MTIFDIISKNTTAKFSGDKEKFLKKFEQLYQLEILRPSLNLIASKCKNKQANFVIEPLKNWDRCVGHCQTKGFFGKVGDIFLRNLIHTINIKTVECDIIMHEIAHAVEKTSGINLNGDFRKVLGLDMNGKISNNMQVAPAVESIMKNELKSYKLNNIMEELFARYFEMLAMSYEVDGFSRYQFKYEDIIAYFENTTVWIQNYFNPLILKLIDSDVKRESKKLVESLEPYKKNWVNDVKETHYDFDESGKKVWASGTKSTNRWGGLNDAIDKINQGNTSGLINKNNLEDKKD